MSLWTRCKIFLKWTFRITAAVILAALIYFSPNIYHIYKWNPVLTPLSSHFYGSAENLEEAQSEDIDFLRKLTKIDRSFSPHTLAEFNTALDDMQTHAGEMSEAEFALSVAQAVALADNGHTNISQRSLIVQHNRLPLRFYWFDGHLHIVRAHPEYEVLVGAEVIAIGDQPASRALALANSYFGGAQNWRTYLSTAILESPALLNAAGIAGDGKTVSLTLGTARGEKTEVTLSALPEAESFSLSGVFPWMVLSDREQPGEETTWASVSEQWTETPVYLARPEVPYFFQEAESTDMLYVHVAFMLDSQGLSIAEFWETLEASISERQFQKIILDLRLNPGGDFTTSVGPVSRLPDHLTVNGRLYIVTSNATFSAALVNTSVAKFHGGDRAFIIGERAGDRDQFWAEGGFPFKLPHSDIGISFATGYHDWVNGCTGRHPYCYDGNDGVENPVSSLDPDIRIPLKFEDYARGHDPVMEVIRSDSLGSG